MEWKTEKTASRRLMRLFRTRNIKQSGERNRGTSPAIRSIHLRRRLSKRWCAGQRARESLSSGWIITLAERSKGPGDNVPYRNQLWKLKLDNFKQNHREDYLIVVIGGIDHMNNSRDSLPSLLKRAAFGHVISVGQHDAMYHYPSSTIVADLAKDDNLSDLIVQQPEYALVNGNGVATFPAPPDYWIVAHTPDTWH